MIGVFSEDGPAAGKLKELRQYIALISQSSVNGEAGDALYDNQEMLSFIDSFFARAPLPYLRKIEVESMLNIGKSSYELFNEYCAGTKPFIFEVKDGQRGSKKISTIRTVTSDRPFIVDSLSALLLKHKVRGYTKLHPILNCEKRGLVSHVYIETERLPQKTLTALNSDLERIFKALLLATNDFEKMLQNAEAVAHSISKSQDPRSPDVTKFIRWLVDRGFVFLGCRTIGDSELKGTGMEPLGFFRSEYDECARLTEETNRDIDYIKKNKNLLHYSKLPIRSPIHRNAYMDAIFLRPQENGKHTYCFVGLFTTRSTTKEALSIPIIENKLNDVITMEGLRPNTHDYKELIVVANHLPKSDLLQYPLENLRNEFSVVSESRRRMAIRVTTFVDPLNRFTILRIFLPTERFSNDSKTNISKYLESVTELKSGALETQVANFDFPLTILTFHIPNKNYIAPLFDLELLERTTAEITSSWREQLLFALQEHFGEEQSPDIFQKYKKAFPGQYRAIHDSVQAIEDIKMLEALSESNIFEISIQLVNEELLQYSLKIYKLGPSLPLSALLPFLSNLGLSIEREDVTAITYSNSDKANIYEFTVTTSKGTALDIDSIDDDSLSNLKLVLSTAAANDGLNELILGANLDCAEIAILRSLAEYLWQIKGSTSRAAAFDALSNYPEASKLLIAFFQAKFDPARFTQDEKGTALREIEVDEVRKDFFAQLKNVRNISHDRTLRALQNILESCLRTNFYQHPNEFRIALKIECSKIISMPSPRPVFETFVSSPELQGVHLRGGKVARGGLRWSDRDEDYRTEVLGLVKTQMVKNSIIVPTGAKGGFVIKNRPKDPKEIRQRVEQAYRAFIRSLLELADNRVDDTFVCPPNSICYDDLDPYLVVAADRGTATFSDIANEIAEKEFSFWLGDAFASGGSFGYDHKKYGITARGAWESVCRHFREIGIDIDSQTVSVVGIGDMSGDVFGNGMLLSRNLKVVAAFNHMHIFIDPTPNPESSFNERQRLFKLPHSSWTDYDASLISAGGGIFERTDKEIEISKEAAAALGTNPGTYSGDEIIQTILRAPVDLLWNGGIGTYVKAFEETNNVVGDPSNDDVRVNARELRARVIGEGGNLGFTQRGRIEYSRIGGHINTDAIDNSGGVDLSDFEVNLKILLRLAQARGEITLEERNQILLDCADEACEKVLHHNKSQAELISLAVKRSRSNVRYYRGLLNKLEEEGLLDREGEFLPDDETLKKRSDLKAGLTRPELALVIAYTKMSLYQVLISSTIPEESFVKKYLIEYFPKSISERFQNDVINHPLKREIISTIIANLLVQRMGASFISRLAEETGARRKDIIYAFLAADNVLAIEERTQKVASLDKANLTRSHLNVLTSIQSVLESSTRWMLNRKSSKPNLSALIESYKEGFSKLVNETPSFIPEIEKNRLLETSQQMVSLGLSKELALEISSFSNSTMYLYVVELSEKLKVDVIEIAHLVSQLSVALQIRELLEEVAEVEARDKWDALAIRAAHADVKRTVAELARRIIIANGDTDVEKMRIYLEDRNEILNCYAESMQEFQKRTITIPALFVVIKQLQALWR